MLPVVAALAVAVVSGQVVVGLAAWAGAWLAGQAAALQPVAGQAGRAEAFQLAAWQALPVAAGGAAAVGLGGQAVQAALLCLARQAAALQPVAGQAGRAGQAEAF